MGGPAAPPVPLAEDIGVPLPKLIGEVWIEKDAWPTVFYYDHYGAHGPSRVKWSHDKHGKIDFRAICGSLQFRTWANLSCASVLS